MKTSGPEFLFVGSYHEVLVTMRFIYISVHTYIYIYIYESIKIHIYIYEFKAAFVLSSNRF